MALTSSPLINWILRAFQALFGIVILGLSVTLIRGHHWGSLPNSLGYAAFVGGVTILAALVGVAATWVSFLEGIVGVAIDGLVALLNIAGGILLAIKLKGVTCKDNEDASNGIKLATNELFNGGCLKAKKNTFNCWVYWKYGENPSKAVATVLGHCRETQATMVFVFMTAALLITSGLLMFLRKRKGY